MRRKRIEEEKKEKRENKLEDEIESRWSVKRILVFVLIIIAIIFFIFYFFQVRSSSSVLGDSDMAEGIGDSPQIDIPSQNDINVILGEAEENIANIDPQDIVSSQPQIQATIEQLEKLVNKDNFKESLCSAICSEK